MSQNTRMRAIRREKKQGTLGYGTHWKTTSSKFAISKEWKGELQYPQTPKFSSPPIQYSIFIGLSILLNLLSVHDSGATVYTCLDRMGQPVFTDSPAQLENCKVFSFRSSTSNTETEGSQEAFLSERVHAENVEAGSSHIAPQFVESRIAEIESMAMPPDLHDPQAPTSTPFSNFPSGDIPPGLVDLLESGNMPPPEIFNEGNVPQGLPFNNGVSPFVELQNELPGTEIQQPGFFIPPDVEAPTLSEIPDSIFSNQSAGPGSE